MENFKRLAILIIVLGFISVGWIHMHKITEIFNFNSEVAAIIADTSANYSTSVITAIKANDEDITGQWDFSAPVRITSGETLMVIDASGDDTLRIFEDGDTTRIESDNPIKVGSGSIVITDDLVLIGCFVKIGSDAPKIKMKKLTGTTSGNEGDLTNLTHGLTVSKIIGCQVFVTQVTSSNLVPPAFTCVPEHEYDFFILGSVVRIVSDSTNSGSIVNRPVTVLITYEE